MRTQISSHSSSFSSGDKRCVTGGAETELRRERRQSLTVSGSFKSSMRRAPQRPPSLDADEFLNLLHGSDPVKVELNRLENKVRGEEQELIWTDLRMEKFREKER
ncbi:Microtubule-associated protein 70-1 [Camellia lanceoleosa]|uniref:Microtubule-associated protein 70-1 n=1 Tax=Camellia lanceoleosa TaxID=1840588 RepID=A0ACC0GHY7_9ERIC|nr:Microtubule-associated protein 70-1 [Camellia lanceoleosa]